MQSEARKLHALSEGARENGDFARALELSEQALLAYQESGDVSGFAEIQASRFLTLRHLFEKTNDQNYLILAKHSAMASVEIAEKSGDNRALAISYFNLAKAQETLGDTTEAVTTYKKAVENFTNNPPTEHNRPSVLADFKVHLATAEYKNNDKSALERAEQALQDLDQAQEDSYHKNVWLSGGHMRIAEMLRKDDSSGAKKHLEEARKIIDSDARLKLRLNQWEKLAATF